MQLESSSRRGEHALVNRLLKLQILLLQIAEPLFVALASLLQVLSHEPRLLVRRSDRRQERREYGTRLMREAINRHRAQSMVRGQSPQVRMALASAGEAMSVTVSCSHGRELVRTPVVLGAGAMYSHIW